MRLTRAPSCRLLGGMIRHQFLLTTLLAFLLGVSATVAADSPKGNIHPNVKLSFSERFRLVTWDNAITLADSTGGGSAFTRHRTSVMGQWYPADELELALKLTNEFRYYFVPESRDFSYDELFVDLLYAKIKTDALIPGTLTVGRQNIIFGEGFVVLDGGPLVGSRCIYFNAARFDWQPRENHKLSLFYMYQPVNDDYLPVLKDSVNALIEQPEEGFGAYYEGKHGKVDLQAYYMRKNQKAEGTRVATEINMIGSRVQLPLAGDLSLAVEGTYQFGTHDRADRSAFGGHFHADYNTHWPTYLPQTLTLGSVYLTGDDPATDDFEGWDPMFARWPKFSESYIYTQVKENAGRVAYWTNHVDIFGRLTFEPGKDMKLLLDYHHLMAPEHSIVADFPGGSGRTRGELFVGKLIFRINPRLTGHILWEGFVPGNFYFDGADGYSWTRLEFLFTI